MTEKPLTYNDIYRNLDGMTALATAAGTELHHRDDERDTAFVKRIVATYLWYETYAGLPGADGQSAPEKS